MCAMISSAHSESLTTSLSNYIRLFFCCPISLARTSSPILHRYEDSGQPHLVSDLVELSLVSVSLDLMLAIDFQ